MKTLHRTLQPGRNDLQLLGPSSRPAAAAPDRHRFRVALSRPDTRSASSSIATTHGWLLERHGYRTPVQVREQLTRKAA